ncbi:MAG: hypothetical protein WHS46_03495 [Desulfosoma sp.]
MQGLLLSMVIAALLGAASVLLFSLAWMSILGMVAAAILFMRGQISGRRCLMRITTNLTRCVGSALTLIVGFQFYLGVLGRGGSPFEQMAYLAGCLPMLLRFFKQVFQRIDRLFDLDKD